MSRAAHLSVFGFIAVAATASAHQPAAEPATEKTPVSAPAVDSAIKVYVDPESGALVSRPPNAAQAAALGRDEFRQDFSRIEEIRKADGSIEWVFNGQVDSALSVVKQDDGSLDVVCSEHGQAHVHAGGARQGAADER